MQLEHSNQEKLQRLDIDVSLLKKDSEITTKVLDKLDTTVESLHELAQAMHRMVSLHEEKFKNQDNTNIQLRNLIEERRSDAIEDIQRVSSSIVDSEKRLVQKFDELKNELNKKFEVLHSMTPGHNEKQELETKLKIAKVVFDNWKYIAFIIAFFIGIITHKWGWFTNLFSGTG